MITFILTREFPQRRDNLSLGQELGIGFDAMNPHHARMRFHDFIRDGDGWRLVANEVLFQNPWLEVHRICVSTPTRPEPVEWTLAHRKGAVVIVPFTEGGNLLLVRQERVPIRATIWEFPAGQIDVQGGEGAVLNAALRELLEETGHVVAPFGRIESLGHFFPSAGFTDEHSHLLLAGPVLPDPDGPRPDATEAITGCRAFSRSELDAAIAVGEIRDANTLAAYARLTAMEREKHPALAAFRRCCA